MTAHRSPDNGWRLPGRRGNPLGDPVLNHPAKSLVNIVLVAAAYFVTARLALLLTLPPGYATAVWPPAGVALGAAMIWRKRGLVGVALGAVAWNGFRLLKWQGIDDPASPVLQALSLAAGVVLQAGVGAWIIRRITGEPIALVRDHHVILFMLLGGPLVCLLSATIGVATLLAAGTLSIEQFWFSWFAWWVGDSIGVLTVAPLVLMWFAEPTNLWKRRRWSIGVPIAVTFAATVTVFVAANHYDTRQELDRLERRADSIGSAFRTRLDSASGLLRACNGFYRSSEKVTRSEFAAFASTLLAEGKGVKSLSWVERVDDSDREAFVQRMRDDGLLDFAVKEIQGELRVVPATRRPVYYCITMIEPFEENSWTIGVDLGSRPATSRAIQAVVETGDIVVSERIQLIGDPDEQYGVVVYHPRFDPNVPQQTPQERGKALLGLNGAVFRLADLVSGSTTRFDRQEVAVQLIDITEPANPQVLFADTRHVSPNPSDGTTRTIEVGGRRWQLQINRLRGYALANQSLQSWMVLAGGLLLTSLLGGLLMILTGRETLIASVVDERTRELSRTNARLAQEQAVTQQVMKELEASRDAAEEADKTKSAFLANMSHEIRTPMTAILGYTDLLIDPCISPQVRTGYAEVVRRNGEHLMEVVNDILDISKIEAGKLAVEMIPCSIDQIVRDVQTMMQPRAHQKGIAFSIEWKGEITRPIRSDPIRVRQILINLVANAIKFTDHGGVSLRVERQYDFIDLVVADTGIGMSARQIASVFEPFMQGDSTMTRRFGGTGLGLAISRHLSKLLGGDLDVRSEVNKGSTFRLRIPAIDVPEAQSAIEPVKREYDVPASLRGRRILLAEDSNDVREFLRQLLVQAQLDVTAVNNGQELIDAALHAGSFNVLLVDMQMPIVDGYEATRRIRAAGITAPIIAVTAHTLESDRQACLDAGCTDYLRKPVRRNELLRHIASALGVEADVSTLQALANPIHSELGDDPIIADLLPVFMNELERYVMSLQEASDAQDVQKVRHLLHNVKGAASTFRFPQLSELASAAGAEMRVRPWGDGFRATMLQLRELAARIRQSTPVRKGV